MNQKNILRLMIVMFCVFASFFTFYAVSHIRGVTLAASELEQMREIRELVHADSPISMMREFVNNDDIIAYIDVPGTSISYPIVQGLDNEYYLHHDLLHRRNPSGIIFLDYAVSPNFSDRSTIIYGHSMQDGTRFYDLIHFLDYSFFEHNRHINIVSTDSVLQYEILAAFTTHISFNYIQIDFPTDDFFLDLVKQIKETSHHSSDIHVGADDKILILSTCFGI